MKPELAAFFQTMDQVFTRPAELAAFHHANGWQAPLERLSLYTRFVQGHIRSTLQKIFPITVAQLGARFEPLAEAYYLTRPARHFELNHAAEGFVSFLANRASALSLPTHLAPLARFEWTDFAIYASEVSWPNERAAPTLNPTLTVLQHSFQLCGWIAQDPEHRTQAPPPGDETALLWRDPKTLRTTFVAADARRLLALKLLIEQAPLPEAAAAAGVEIALLENALLSAANEGFVLAPA